MACPTPFLDDSTFPSSGGFLDGRICETYGDVTCCLPCPMTDWTYNDGFIHVGIATQWVAVGSTCCCLFLLLSWTVLPIDKTHRHYLSICLTIAVVMMNLGFIIPLLGRPDQCYNDITPNDMQSSSQCAASGTFIILGGWTGILWVFLRSLSLHMQICWQIVVGRNFLWFSQIVGWGVPVIGSIFALTLSGVSFRFGDTCHINHHNSLEVLWVPLLVFAAMTLILQVATFGYCIRVYLASLSDNNMTTATSAGLPSYTISMRTMTPRQAYRRVRRVLQLQWRGIATVLIIITDVIFFAVVFVFQDDTVQSVRNDPGLVNSWILCLVQNQGDKTPCLPEVSGFVVNTATIGAVLILLAMDGFWLLILLGRWSMVTGWADLLMSGREQARAAKREFVSVDALGGAYDFKRNTDPRSYEMLSRDKDELVTRDMFTVVREGEVYPPLPSYQAQTKNELPAAEKDDAQQQQPQQRQASPSPSRSAGGGGGGGGGGGDGRRTPDYFGATAKYNPPTRSFSSPRPPTRDGAVSVAGSWERASVAGVVAQRPYSPPGAHHYSQSQGVVNPLQMNRVE